MSSRKMIYRAACLAALFLLYACGGGDDDGRRLGDVIVGTWQRGYGKGDVIIEGDTELEPENLTYDKFIFQADGNYNGMVRNGSFTTLNDRGETIFAGEYRCDNHNLKMTFTSDEGNKQTILAQVLSFTESTMQVSWQSDDGSLTVTFILRKEG